MGQTPYFDVGGIFQAGLVRADDRGDPGLSGTGHGGPDVFCRGAVGGHRGIEADVRLLMGTHEKSPLRLDRCS